MSRHFQVIGDYEDPYVQGAVLGDVMGDDDDGAQVVGHDDYGRPIVVTGRGKGRRRGRAMVPVQRPEWRDQQLAPGVIAPDQGLVPLPLGDFTFSVANGQIFTFQGQMQKPFRGERLLVTTQRTGTTAVARLLGQIFVGTDLSQADINRLDLEAIGNPGAFGVRLTMKPAQPGVLIRIPVVLSGVIAGTDTLFCSVQLLGRIVH